MNLDDAVTLPLKQLSFDAPSVSVRTLTFCRPVVLDLHLSISIRFVSSRIYEKCDDFDFPFLDGDVPRSTSYGVYISQLIRFARVSNHVSDFEARDKVLTVNFSIRAIGIINFERLFLSFIADTMNWFQNSRSD